MTLTNAFIDTAPLRHSPRFRRLWIGRTCSWFGGMMTVVAVMYQVWQGTHSTVWSGAVGIAQAAPVIAFGLFAGTLVDRVDRRRCYLVVVIGQAACSVLLAVQGFAHQLPVGGLLVLVAVQSGFGAGAGPAARTFIAALLPKSELAAGLALNRISFGAAMLAGPAVGGLVLGWLGVGGCYLVDAITFGLAFYGVFGLPPLPPGDTAARPGLRGVADGLAFLIGNRAVRGALLTDLAATVLAMPTSLFALINAERFGDNPRTLGLFFSAIAVGGLAASIFSGTFTRRARPGVVMLVGSTVWGASLALFGIAPNPWVGLACLAVAGIADTLSVVSRGTIIQTHTPNELLGRVTAAEQIVGQAGPDVGNLRAGLVANFSSGWLSLLSGGLLCVAAVALVGVSTPELRAAASTEQPPK